MDKFNTLSNYFNYDLIDCKEKLFKNLNKFLFEHNKVDEFLTFRIPRCKHIILFLKFSAIFEYDILQKKVVYEHKINEINFHNELNNKRFLKFINEYIKDYKYNINIHKTYYNIVYDTFKNIKNVRMYSGDFKIVYLNEKHLVLENDKKSLCKISINKFINDIIENRISLEYKYLYLIERNLKLMNREENLPKILKVL